MKRFERFKRFELFKLFYFESGFHQVIIQMYTMVIFKRGPNPADLVVSA